MPALRRKTGVFMKNIKIMLAVVQILDIAMAFYSAVWQHNVENTVLFGLMAIWLVIRETMCDVGDKE